MQPAAHDEHDDTRRKLSAARAQLIVEKPFLGVLVLHLPLTEAEPAWCRAVATDTRAIYYNRAYVERLTLEQVKFVLAHEALHGALSHFNRREHRDRRRWDIACDFAVNAILVADGLMRPSEALFERRYNGMSAEEIYTYIKDDARGTPMDQHLYDAGGRTSDNAERKPGPGTTPPPPPGDSAPSDAASGDSPHGPPAAQTAPDAATELAPPPTPPAGSEREQLSAQWRLRLASAAQQALRAGKLPGSMARLIDALLYPQLPWRMLLAHYMTSIARTDYSFNRPSRREGDAILPGLRAACIDVVVAIDTSGSIDQEEMREFVSEVSAIKGQLNARVTLHACDAALAAEGPWIFEPWNDLRLPTRLTGGGGTRFTPVFEWIEQREQQPDLLVYCTDAEGEFPAHEPTYPVLWLVKGKASVPWGQRVQLN